MARNQKEVEDALFQIKNLEESLQRNAQGILSSTMKREINSLVKESLKEQDEVEDEDEEEDVEVDYEDTDTDNEEGTDDEEYDMGDMEDTEMMGQPVIPSDNDTVDMTGASDAEVLRVFRAMGDNDGVVVKRDENMIHLSDSENNAEYIIQLSESMGDSELNEFGKSEFDMYDFHHPKKDKFSFGDDDEDKDEFSFEDEFSLEDDEEEEDDDYGLGMPNDMAAYKTKYQYPDEEEEEDDDDDEDEFSFEDDYESLAEEEETSPEQLAYEKGETTENIYELELDEDSDMFGGSGSKRSNFDLDEDEDFSAEEYNSMMESKGFKAKGVGMGNASKYRMSKKPNMDGGFKTISKKPNKTMGTGKAKFEYKDEVNDEGFTKKVGTKKIETKEAARTRGNGSNFRSGGLPKARAHSKANTAINEELTMLRNKNDEYRKALNLFRTKLNEVAIFNSNLAYATRLFTEHSTTKPEKINILRRFDNVETLKESKNLYRSIKSELDSPKTSDNTITESVQRRVEKTPLTGSAANLIESKTYENPQFLRMKDLMAKIK